MSTTQTIARATAVIAGFTLLSKVLGFVREMALAWVFGASAATDAYLVAYTVPNVVFAILGGALTVMVVPLFASYAAAGKKEEAWRLFAVFSTLLSAILLAVVLVGLPLARQIVWLVAPGLPEGTARLAASMLAVMLPGVLFLTPGSLYSGLLVIAFTLAGLKYGIVAVGTLLGNTYCLSSKLLVEKRWGMV
ncbi:lipid II flippase MurJ [Desulfovirgula thermocuniculi]|uniref:lipid II flippase MurJ n=1 Tax=Desulfovirgula thermocuniculi TaxID=348842 RepID=UPI00042328B5|nr:lipid II flippase MurJ [Desulfovirgula thermocuniculi]